MEGGNFLRFIFFSLSLVLVILFTWFINLPHAPPSATNILECTASSPWCTSSKNRIFQPKPQPHPTSRHGRSHAREAPLHPLDPLTIGEINLVKAILSSHALFKSPVPHSLHSVELKQPEKCRVLKWKQGDPHFPGKVSVLARERGVSHILIVDLDTSEVIMHQTGPHFGYPTMIVEDMTMATAAPLVSSEFNHTIIG